MFYKAAFTVWKLDKGCEVYGVFQVSGTIGVRPQCQPAVAYPRSLLGIMWPRYAGVCPGISHAQCVGDD